MYSCETVGEGACITRMVQSNYNTNTNERKTNRRDVKDMEFSVVIKK